MRTNIYLSTILANRSCQKMQIKSSFFLSFPFLFLYSLTLMLPVNMTSLYLKLLAFNPSNKGKELQWTLILVENNKYGKQA